MQILFFLPVYPFPPHSGLALRAYGLIRGLKTLSAGDTLAVDVLSFVDGSQGEISQPDDALCRQIVTVPAPPWLKSARLKTLALTGLPDLAKRLESDGMRAAFADMLKRTDYDAVIYMGLETAVYMDQGKAATSQTAQIYDAQNVEHILQQRMSRVDQKTLRRLPASWYSRAQVGRILKVERAVVRKASAVTAVSEGDAAYLADFRDDRHVTVIENGIFVQDYGHRAPTIQLTGEALVFTGKMDYRPNVDAVLWFAERILPLIQEKRPQARLYAVGQKPHSSLSALAARSDVEITGWVPSVLPFLTEAAVYVAPLRMGSGTRLKLLEACAAGCASVATPIGAEGLTSEIVEALCIAADESAFAQAVVHLLESATERDRLGKLARERVAAHYDWPVIAPRLLTLLDSLTSASHGH